MITQADFVNEVREWVGTPFHHLGRLKGVGADCVGVVVGACKNLGVEVQDMRYYPKLPINRIFIDTIEAQTNAASLDQLQIGDLLLFTFKHEPQHIAVVSSLLPRVTMIHAFSKVDRCVENDFDRFWVKRLHSVRRLRVFA